MTVAEQPVALVPSGKVQAPDAIVSQAVELGAPYEPPLSPEDADWSQHVLPSAVDKRDQDTPDNWVRRDPRILRLTGRHPLNCEPPMSVLMQVRGICRGEASLRLG